MGKTVAPSGSKSNGAAANGSTDFITLPNGKQVPVGLPTGVSPEQAKGVIDYLKSNPEAAERHYMEAQRVLGQPGMASVIQAQQQAQQSPAYQQQLAQLREDPELKSVFEDIEASGGKAMEKYWNDTELMTKIAARMQSVSLDGPATPPPEAGKAKKHSSPVILQDAAKAGDLATVKRLLREGADVNQADMRGITPLGVAVGFNRIAIVEALLEAGADVEKPDGRGNTVLHYAAGYGRKDVAQMLLDAGSDVQATNQQGQMPIDAAKINREMHMVSFLDRKAAKLKPAQTVKLAKNLSGKTVPADEDEASKYL